jgi:hypothetical protein
MTRNDLGTRCLPCAEGYWCNGYMNTVPCFGDASKCLGALGCVRGYRDDAEGCSQCAAGFYEGQRTPQTAQQRAKLDCKECPSDIEAWIAGGVVSAVVFFLTFVYLNSWKKHDWHNRGCYWCYTCCRRCKHAAYKHSIFVGLAPRQWQALSILSRAKSLPYPSGFRDFISNFANIIPAPVKVECAKGSGWTFSDSYKLYACAPLFVILLIPIDILLLQSYAMPTQHAAFNPAGGGAASNQNVENPEEEALYAQSESTPGSNPHFQRRAFWELLTTQWRRWFVNEPRGTRRGYDHTLYSAQFLQYSVNNFFPYALMAWVKFEQEGRNGVWMFYEPKEPFNTSSPMTGWAIFFFICYCLSLLWSYALPLCGIGCGPRDEDGERVSIPYADFNDKVFTFVQHLIPFIGSFVVLAPFNIKEMSALLLSLACIEAAAYLFSIYLNLARNSSLMGSMTILQLITKPFMLREEQLLYMFQLVLAIITYGVGLDCASKRCDTSSNDWADSGWALIILHSLFFVAYAGILLALVCCRHIPERDCENKGPHNHKRPVQSCWWSSFLCERCSSLGLVAPNK